MKFDFRFWTSLVDNRSYEYSQLTRMCQSCDVELNVPFTDYHYIFEIKTSLFPWLARPDAWRITTEGALEREPVFPYAEWVVCEECGEDVVSDDLDDHVSIRHEGEHIQFGTATTRDEYADY